MLPDGLSVQACLALGLHSVSELATREPEPVLPSARFDGVPTRAALSAHVSVVSTMAAAAAMRGGIPRERELSLPGAVELKAKALMEEGPFWTFQMLLPHGCDERSESAPLSERALPKSRDRVWRVLLVGRELGAGKVVRTLPVMAAMLRLESLGVGFMYKGCARAGEVCM
jgi:hypothetical protein